MSIIVMMLPSVAVLLMLAQTPQPFPKPGASKPTTPATPSSAGKGQRYYLFGTNASFTEIVNYYRVVLKQKGELIFDEPAVHEFDIGKYKEETMAFPPSVTVKDYAWGGSAGYLNPKRGKQPERFKTIIQIVPATF